MSIPVFQGGKKKRGTPKIYGFHTFGHAGCPIEPKGPFRDNVRAFLQECAEPEGYNVDGMPVWCTSLVDESRGFLVPLYTIEENVRHSLTPFCDRCRCTGWSRHFVSKRKYHMIIPVDNEWDKPLDDGVFDLQTHLLHALIHCNGFGHLLCINGIEGGSKHLCGREVMDLWDRICNNLHAWKITVEDESKKRMMDLRLLHGVAYGHPWFGRWGYRFCRGSFGATEHKYERAVDFLSSLELEKIILDFSTTNRYRGVRQIVCYYRDLSETKLITLRDLLRFMLTLKSRVPFDRKLAILASAPSACAKPSTRATLQCKHVVLRERGAKCRKFSNVAANLDSRWPVRRLEYAANVIVSALKEKKATNKSIDAGMTRQEARDAARLHIGDTGLIDYVLKSMNNVIVGGLVVRRAVNPATRVLEYTIQELGDEIRVNDPEPKIVHEPIPSPAVAAGVDVYADVTYLYKNILLDYPESEVVGLAVQTILDTKHFVKEWPFKDEDDELLRYVCRIVPSLSDLETEMVREFSSPGEQIVLPLHATIGELKEAMQAAMRDTYCVTEQILITDIERMEEMEDGEVLFGAIEPGSELWLRAQGMDLETELKYEGGADNWTVRCRCGARDDDGERMVACDICEIWQHTRCSGIDDAEAVPPLFVCSKCCASLMPSRAQPPFQLEDFVMEPLEC